MSARLDLQGVTLELNEEALAELARQLLPLIELRGATSQPEPWIRGAEAAAGYLGCKPKRIYQLVELDQVEYRKDGRVLTFRREWLDAVNERPLR